MKLKLCYGPIWECTVGLNCLIIQYSSTVYRNHEGQDAPFHQPQQLQCFHHGSTKAYSCSPLCTTIFSTAV